MIPAFQTFWPSCLIALVLTAIAILCHVSWRYLRRGGSGIERIDQVYKSIAENSLHGLLVIQDMRIIFANSAFAEISGYSVPQLIELSPLEVRNLIHPEGRDSVWGRYDDRLDGKKVPTRYEVRGVRKNGSPVWLELAAKLVEFGGKSAVQAAVADISERKRAEQALQESESRHRAVLDAIPDLMFRMSREGVFLSFHGSAEELYVAEKEFLGRTAGDVLPADIAALNSKYINLALTTREVQVYEYDLKIDGDLRHFEARMTSSGEAEVLVIVRNVTEQKRAERALCQSEERYRQLVQNAPIGIASVDAKGCIIDANPAFVCLLGAPSRTALDSINLLNSPEFVEAGISDDIERCLKTQSRVSAERPFTSSWSKRVLSHYHLITSRDEEGRPAGVQVVVEDVAAKRQLEEELIKAEKLDSIGLLAGGIAHNFNNILTAVLGNVSLAKHSNVQDGTLRELLDDAEAALERAQDLTRQLLTFARGGEPIREAVSLRKLIEESVGLILHEPEIECRLDVASDLHAIEADRCQISQVISNLIINATQAMPQGGVLHIAARNFSVDRGEALGLSPGEYVEMIVKDSGVGISAKILPRIFDPYFTTKETGSGLGLAAVYSIIKRHRGSLHAESEPGKGAAFHVRLPACGRKIDMSVGGPAFSDREEARILLMDDEEVIRVVTARMLRSLGYRVDAVAEGREAISAFRKAQEQHDPFDLVIFDLTIPGGLGGLETLTHIRALDPDVRAVVSSGYSNDPIIANYCDHGFQGYVGKPYRTEDLAQVVRQVLNPAAVDF